MHNKFKFVLFFPLLFLTLSLLANEEEPGGTIQGTVTTVEGKPAEMVTVVIQNTKRATITDEKGRFIFRNVKDGNYTLKISLVGYEHLEKEVTVANSETVTADFQLTLSTVQLSEVIVRTIGKKPHDLASDYVSKMPLKNIENPQVYASIGKTILENQMLYSVDEAFRNVTGVQKMWSATNRSGDGGAYINLRGFIAGNSLRNGLVAPVSTTIDAVNIEKFEVLKGPSATLFGSNVTSYGGVINRVTKKPYDSFGGTVSVTGGSYNYYRAQTDINTPLTKDKKLILRFNSAYTSSGTFQNKDAKNNYFAVVPALAYKFNDKLDVNVEYEHFYTKAVPEQVFFYLSPSLVGVDNMNDLEKAGLEYKNAYVGSGLYTTGKVNNILAQVNYKLNSHLRSSTNINGSGSYSNGFNPYFAIYPQSAITGDVNDTELGIVRADQSTSNSRKKYFQVQQNFNADFNIGSMRNRTVAGFDFLKTKDDQVFKYFFPFDWVPMSGADYTTMNSTTVSERYESGTGVGTWLQKGVLNTYSGYVSNVLTPLEGLNVLAAVRYESNNFLGGTLGSSDNPAYHQAAWSPKFGVIYQIVHNRLSVFGNYQNSFTSNGYYVSDNSGTSSLSDPETANQFEGGFKTSIFNGKINAVLSYYNIQVRNSLLTTTEPVVDDEGTPTGQYVQSQAGKRISKGVELEIDAYLVKGFSLLGGLSYNDSRYTEADADVQGRRPNTASSPWLANFNASYQFMDGKLRGLGFGIGGNYASDNKIVNSASAGVFLLPGYFVLNANAFYDAKKFRIGVKADNFTNEHYWLGYTTANPQALINVAGSFTYKF
ncbi:MAG: TonB-dependent receptor [Niabella sp.]